MLCYVELNMRNMTTEIMSTGYFSIVGAFVPDTCVYPSTVGDYTKPIIHITYPTSACNVPPLHVFRNKMFHNKHFVCKWTLLHSLLEVFPK